MLYRQNRAAGVAMAGGGLIRERERKKEQSDA
jgi:hypothetical protein